ncbi:MAG: beta-N-acetylhexosaminidase, partial [Alphaproteobacteria bacterium]
MTETDLSRVSAIIYGCAGPQLSDEQRRFFAEVNPLGFILFDYNVETPDQVRALTAALRETVGRADAPIMIDQEGGRVARLGPPHWREAPPAARFGELDARDPERGVEATRINARLLAAELYELGINVDCAPVLDVPVEGAHDIIGDRAYSYEPARVARLGRAAAEGFLAGGVAPVVKHMPGHGRATEDSHIGLPVVETDRNTLEKTDFLPFRELADLPWAMTAHVLYRDVDADLAATVSTKVQNEVIRGHIGFEGIVLSDDIRMEALAGTPVERTRAILAAGCDLVLECSGELDKMKECAEGAGPLSAVSARRVARAAAM